MELERLLSIRGMTDAELARQLDCQRSTVLHWKRGSHFPRADMLLKICRVLECSADELLGQEKTVGISLAKHNALYKAVTQQGHYDWAMWHQMATKVRRAAKGKMTPAEILFRNIGEALYKIQLVAKAPGAAIDAMREEYEQMSMF
jgi:transcriptional regulator with XRE-family HTH domain